MSSAGRVFEGWHTPPLGEGAARDTCITTRRHSKVLSGTQRHTVSAAQPPDQQVRLALTRRRSGVRLPQRPPGRRAGGQTMQGSGASAFQAVRNHACRQVTPRVSGTSGGLETHTSGTRLDGGWLRALPWRGHPCAGTSPRLRRRPHSHPTCRHASSKSDPGNRVEDDRSTYRVPWHLPTSGVKLHRPIEADRSTSWHDPPSSSLATLSPD